MSCLLYQALLLKEDGHSCPSFRSYLIQSGIRYGDELGGAQLGLGKVFIPILVRFGRYKHHPVTLRTFDKLRAGEPPLLIKHILIHKSWVS